MMTPNSLNRATAGFRCGYNDALNRRDYRATNNDSFWSSDYAEGYCARLNEIYWEAHGDNKEWDKRRASNLHRDI